MRDITWEVTPEKTRKFFDTFSELHSFPLRQEDRTVRKLSTDNRLDIVHMTLILNEIAQISHFNGVINDY